MEYNNQCDKCEHILDDDGKCWYCAMQEYYKLVLRSGFMCRSILTPIVERPMRRKPKPFENFIENELDMNGLQ
jgi:hypothetical protein